MRIISGSLRGRQLESPRDETSRPYPDRVRQSVFNILRGWFEDANVLDLFAGVGSMGIEALSRGARSVLFVERDRRVAGTLTANIAALNLSDRARVHTGDALSLTALASAPRPVQVAFVDPPYPLVEGEDADAVFDLLARIGRDLLDPRGFIVLRTPWPYRRRSLAVPSLLGPETHLYGSMAVHLYQSAPSAAPST